MSVPLRLAALLCLVALLAPPAHSAPPAPAAQFTVSANPEVGRPVSFDASASTGTGLTYAWDFNGDDVTDALGRTVSYTYSRPGTYNVSLTVTDATAATDVRFRVLPVDDFVTLDLQIFEDSPDVATATLARLSLKAWDGAGIGGLVVDVRSFYKPVDGASSRLLRVMAITLAPDGSAVFPIPRDTALANLPGSHFATAVVEVHGTALGNIERATDTETYTVGI